MVFSDERALARREVVCMYKEAVNLRYLRYLGAPVGRLQEVTWGLEHTSIISTPPIRSPTYRAK